VLRRDVFAPERESVPDQTWSAAAFLSSAVRGMLGLDLDATKRELRFAPSLPPGWGSLRVRQVHLASADITLSLWISRDVVELAIENSGPAMTLVFRQGLTSDRDVRVGTSTVGGRLVRGARVAGAYEARIACPANRTTRLTLRLA